MLGLIKPEYFAHGNANAARKAMQPLADYMGKTVEEVAEQILTQVMRKLNRSSWNWQKNIAWRKIRSVW